MKIEINKWLFYLPLFVSLFWIIYRWNITLVNLSKKQKDKDNVKKESKKWKVLPGGWYDSELKEMPKHLKLTKIDCIIWGIFFYFIYYFKEFSYVIDYKK
mgnify:CR=1 FL=1